MKICTRNLPRKIKTGKDKACCPRCNRHMRFEDRLIRNGVDQGHSLWHCDHCGEGCISPDQPIYPEPDPRAMQAARAIWADLGDRRGIRFGPFDDDVLEEILASMAYGIGCCFGVKTCEKPFGPAGDGAPDTIPLENSP